MNHLARKWIVHQVNGSYIKGMDRTSIDGLYLQGTGSYRECVVPQGKWIVSDGKELGQQFESQAPSLMST